MADEDDETEGGSGGGTSMVMLGGVGLVAFLLGGGAGFAGHMFLMPCEECTVEEDADDTGQPTVDPSRRAVVTLHTMTVNLRGTGGGRVLRMEVQVEVPFSEEEMIKDSAPVLRDAVITLASDYTFGDLEGIDGKTRFRDELLARLNGAISKPVIKRIYFTKFVVQ